MPMAAAVLAGRRSIEIRDLQVPEPGPGTVLVRVGHAAICGTDHHIYLGEFEGRVAYPAVMGHEFGGVVDLVQVVHQAKDPPPDQPRRTPDQLPVH